VSHPYPYGNPEKTSSINGAYRDESCRDAQNVTGTSGKNWHKYGTGCSVSVPGELKNPGALAGATGAGNIEQAFKTQEYRTRAIAASALGSAIAECHPADACILMQAALADLLAERMPSAPFLGIMKSARFWAQWASVSEVKAYCLASFERLSAADRSAFLAHVGARIQ
jgi:hypothetical protein